MSLEIVPFKAEHMEQVLAQEAQQYLRAWLKPGEMKALEGPWAYSGVVDGRVHACAGLVSHWPGRAAAWAYLDAQAGREMLAVTRAAKRGIEMCPFDRIEAAVDCEFEAGHRWARILGFELETERMRKYRPDGGDCAMYVRVR